MMIALLLATVYALVTAMAYLATAVRLITYAREGARYRPGISTLAALLIAFLLVGALNILLYRPAVNLSEAVVAVLLCSIVIRARGNLATLLTPGGPK